MAHRRPTPMFTQHSHRTPRPQVETGQCVLPVYDGGRCRNQAVAGFVAPLCTQHLLDIYDQVRSVFESTTSELTVRAAIERLEEAANPVEKPGIVYYLQIGDLIKIGWTTDLDQRLATYPPNRKVLALERGDSQALERKRLGQFKHLLRHPLEWFDPGDDLIAWINQLRPADRQIEGLAVSPRPE